MTVADSGPGGGVPGTMVAWFTRLGPLAVARPAPAFGRSLAGAGGALVATGVVVVGGDRWASSGSTIPAVVIVGVLLAAAMGAVGGVRTPPAVAAAGVAASGIAGPALAFFLGAGGGFPSLRLVALLAGVIVACLYAVGPWRGHTFHLSILVVAGWILALSFTDLGIGRASLGGFRTIGDAVSGAGAASMVVGVVYLGLGSWLHEEGLRGMATPFLAVAALALPLGALALLRDADGALRGLVALALAVAVGVVGARCRRRGTMWIGVAIGAVGVVGLADGLARSTAVEALLVVVAGAGLVWVAPVASAVLGEPLPSDPSTADQRQPPTASTPEEPEWP